MSTLHMRSRRFLSAHRRTGLQCDADAARGIAGRHAQGWRSINIPPDDELGVARQIAECCVMAAVVWACIAVCVWAIATYL